jgi:hypothetical protein
LLQQKHDIWKIGLLEKKQKFTHEIATKNSKSHTPDYKKTQNCTRKQKITYQATEKKL